MRIPDPLTYAPIVLAAIIVATFLALSAAYGPGISDEQARALRLETPTIYPRRIDPPPIVQPEK